MEINKRFQDLHSNNPSFWVELQQVEKDICLLYHQLANYSYIMGDLYYGDVFDKAYWKYLSFPSENLKSEELDFLIEGCFIFILAMCSEILDGTGGYLLKHIDECEMNVLKMDVATLNEKQRKLHSLTSLAVKNAKEGKDWNSDITDGMLWAHKAVIRDYFASISKDFEQNPYFK